VKGLNSALKGTLMAINAADITQKQAELQLTMEKAK